jgi:hypothetical protein
MQSSIGGMSAKWSVALTAGYASGYVSLDGTASGSTFGVLADKFYVAQPGVSGGAARQVFSIGNINGTPTIGIDGAVVIDGTVKVRHLDVISLSAISADLGEVKTGLVRNESNTLRFDLTNMRWYRTDGKAEIDLLNRILYFESD